MLNCENHPQNCLTYVFFLFKKKTQLFVNLSSWCKWNRRDSFWFCLGHLVSTIPVFYFKMIWESNTIYTTLRAFNAFFLNKNMDIFTDILISHGLQFKSTWILWAITIKIRQASQHSKFHCLWKHKYVIAVQSTNRMIIQFSKTVYSHLPQESQSLFLHTNTHVHTCMEKVDIYLWFCAYVLTHLHRLLTLWTILFFGKLR